MAAINTLYVLFHVLTLDFVVNYNEIIDEVSVAQETSLIVYILVSFPAIILIGVFQALFIWPFSALGLWVWSKVKPLELEYYEDQSKEI